MGGTSKALVLRFTLICGFDIEAGRKKSVTLPSDDAYVFDVLSNYLERIRFYGPNKRKLNRWTKTDVYKSI